MKMIDVAIERKRGEIGDREKSISKAISIIPNGNQISHELPFIHCVSYISYHLIHLYSALTAAATRIHM